MQRSTLLINVNQGFPQQAGFPPRSGYDELDTTLMPPRPGADPYARNTPSPGAAGHPGYAGYPAPAQQYSAQSSAPLPRSSLPDSYPAHQYLVQEPLYGTQGQDSQYQAYTQYDPNMSNSVFEDGEDGYG